MTVCIGDLNRKGFSCTTEAFLHNLLIGDIINCILQQSSSSLYRMSAENLTKFMKRNFTIEILEIEHKNEIITFLIDNFYTRDPLSQSLSVSIQDFTNVISQMFDNSIKCACSYCIKDVVSKAVVGVQISEDSSNEEISVSGEHSENLITRFLQYCKPKMINNLTTPKLNSNVVAISTALDASFVIKLLYFIEKHTIDLARQNNYKTIETINTSESTKVTMFLI